MIKMGPKELKRLKCGSVMIWQWQNKLQMLISVLCSHYTLAIHANRRHSVLLHCFTSTLLCSIVSRTPLSLSLAMARLNTSSLSSIMEAVETHSMAVADPTSTSTVLQLPTASSTFGASTPSIATSPVMPVSTAKPKTAWQSLATLSTLTTVPRPPAAFTATSSPTGMAMPANISIVTTIATITLTAGVQASTPSVDVDAGGRHKIYRPTAQQEDETRNALLIAGALLLLAIGACIFSSCYRKKQRRAARNRDEEAACLASCGSRSPSAHGSERTLCGGSPREAEGPIDLPIRHVDTVSTMSLSLRGGGAPAIDGEESPSDSDADMDDLSESADDDDSATTDSFEEVILGDAPDEASCGVFCGPRIRAATFAVSHFSTDAAEPQSTSSGTDRIEPTLRGPAFAFTLTPAPSVPIPTIRITPPSPDLRPARPPPVPVARTLRTQRAEQHAHLPGIDKSFLWAFPLHVALREQQRARKQAARDADAALAEGLARAALDRVVRMPLADCAAPMAEWPVRPSLAFVRYLARGAAALDEACAQGQGGERDGWPRVAWTGETEVRAPVELWGRLAERFQERMRARVAAEEAAGSDVAPLLKRYPWLWLEPLGSAWPVGELD